MHIPSPTPRQAVGWTLRLATAAALAVDAYVHADLVDHYAANRSPGTLSQGDLFHIEAGAASLAALLIILKGWRGFWAFAAIVAGSTEVEAARQLIAYLASDRAGAAIENNGMEPVGKR